MPTPIRSGTTLTPRPVAPSRPAAPAPIARPVQVPLAARGNPKNVLRPRDVLPIAEQVNTLAIDDGVLSRGDVDALISSISNRKLTSAGERELRAAVQRHGAAFTPDARLRLNRFLNGEVAGLRVGRARDVADQQFLGDRNTAILTWTPPTHNVDGSTLLDLAGYKVYMGKTPGAYTQVLDVNDPSAVGYVADRLSPGTWYFAVTSVNAAGEESAKTNAVSKAIN